MRKLILFIGIISMCVVLSACKSETRKVADLENQIFEEYAPSPNEVGYPISYDKFKEILSKFPEASFGYDFNKLTEIGYVKIVDSPDQTIRTYTQNDGSLFALQVKSDKNILTFNPDEDELSSLSLYSLENVANIFSVKADRGDIIYIICSKDNQVAAVRLMGDKLQPAMVFDEEDGNFTSFLSAYISADEAKIEYKYDSREFVYPEDEEKDAIEYALYTFNGRVFKKSGTFEESLLHASVQDYDELLYCFTSEKVNVRIDRLKGGTFRYASWKNGRKFSEKPDLVLFGNNVKENYETGASEFTFTNEGYSYIMKTGGDNAGAVLLVVKDGRTLARYTED